MCAKKHPIGTKVDVWSEDEVDYLGVGVIMDYERITVLGETIRIDETTPIILFPGGETVRGFECEYDVLGGD